MTPSHVVRPHLLVAATLLLSAWLLVACLILLFLAHVALRTGAWHAIASLCFSAAVFAIANLHLLRRLGPLITEDLLRLRLQAFVRQTGADLLVFPSSDEHTLIPPADATAHQRAALHARSPEIAAALRIYRRLTPASRQAEPFRISADALRQAER